MKQLNSNFLKRSLVFISVIIFTTTSCNNTSQPPSSSGGSLLTTSPLQSPLDTQAKATSDITLTDLQGYITFSSDNKGNSPFQVYTMQANGNDLKALTSYAGRTIEPSWSPDGKHIAFVSSSENTNGLDLYVMNSDRSDVKKIVSKQNGYTLSPRWAHDGQSIFFYAAWGKKFEIYQVKPDGSSLQAITDGSANDYMPDPSPDGAKLVFVSERGGNPEIYTMNADGTNVKRLTSDDQVDWRPRWSPDGSKISFESTRDGYRRVFTMTPDGSNVNAATPEGYIAGDSVWIEDGQRILFSYRLNSETMIIWRLGVISLGETSSQVKTIYESATDLIYSDWVLKVGK